jgi:methylthioribose-1-phosphate isomerase
MSAKIETLRWVGDENGHLVLIDQTRLPLDLVELECRDLSAVWEAIKQLRVRGAPAIGIAAAYGVVIGLQTADLADKAAFFARLDEVTKYLATSRPTAVNLFWALERMKGKASALRSSSAEIHSALFAEARAIHDEDRALCRAIGRYGAELIQDKSGVLTHCNAGGLATAEYGTALSVLFTCQDQGKKLHVFVDETRPLLQGSRLTAWELAQRGIDATLICDNMAGQVMREGKVQAVIVGADRITASSAPTASRLAATPPIKSAPIPSPSSPPPTTSPFTSPPPPRRLICPSTPATRSPSKSAPQKKSLTASAAKPPPPASTSITPPSTSPRRASSKPSSPNAA